MATGVALNTCVFLFAFASMFLLGGKRPLLALSTRGLLVVLLGLGFTYVLAADAWYRPYVGVATLIANVLFVAFAAIDFRNWQNRRAGER
ncbi:hypothetical protein WPS_09370 [Vulcanimicrobium alpinum]|uniref:Uncharacterized protein n=1 Tax=Vulcanimicrobium alpinum TaxID=3016050 RepID=A0AAN1XW87_UNVUL|nr:hypothetical protein [Vulcanimicrobium alpinum]BDE05661.1 hypothetical protein WPS_09370 [Vulcanimicrobium alpinum]